MKALSHRTLIMLLGADPSNKPDAPVPCTDPQVTFAYIKHLWKNSQKVNCILNYIHLTIIYAVLLYMQWMFSLNIECQRGDLRILLKVLSTQLMHTPYGYFIYSL